MNLRPKPSIDDSAKRNPGVTPERVQKMQEIVKTLQDRGVLAPSKYDLQPGLSAPKAGLAASNGLRMMNRVKIGL